MSSLWLLHRCHSHSHLPASLCQPAHSYHGFRLVLFPGDVTKVERFRRAFLRSVSILVSMCLRACTFFCVFFVVSLRPAASLSSALRCACRCCIHSRQFITRLSSVAPCHCLCHRPLAPVPVPIPVLSSLLLFNRTFTPPV